MSPLTAFLAAVGAANFGFAIASAVQGFRWEFNAIVAFLNIGLALHIGGAFA